MSVNALAGILRRKGFHVSIAHTVQDGLRGLADEPDFVLLDLMLPDGDGAQVLRHVRAHQLPVNVVVMTAVSEPARLAQVRDLKPEQLIRKPVDLMTLLRTLDLKN